MNYEGIMVEARKTGRKTLTEIESKAILRQAGIEVNDTRLATSRQEAVRISRELGFPVVLKIVSPSVTHKTDVGGVRLDLMNTTQVNRAYGEIIASVKREVPEALIQGISVQRMVKQGIEIAIGMVKDPEFGPMVMFGLGGVMVELLKDVSFRVAPLTGADAREMLREIKGYPLLTGYRGQQAVNLSTLEDTLLKVSEFALETPEVSEMDLNPVIASEHGAITVDARIILE